MNLKDKIWYLQYLKGEKPDKQFLSSEQCLRIKTQGCLIWTVSFLTKFSADFVFICNRATPHLAGMVYIYR